MRRSFRAIIAITLDTLSLIVRGSATSPPSFGGWNEGGGIADTEPPTITILGNNPAVIEVGASYADMGVAVTDNIDQNLGYTASLNGGPALSQGAGLSIATSTTTPLAGGHTILYTATDSAGNTATATRIVEIITAP